MRAAAQRMQVRPNASRPEPGSPAIRTGVSCRDTALDLLAQRLHHAALADRRGDRRDELARRPCRAPSRSARSTVCSSLVSESGFST
jgi:hypothetical protein